jgi:hypothetical protein
MTTPFSIAATLQLPGDSGLPADPIPFNVSSQFGSLSEMVLNLSGSGTKAVALGTINTPGVVGLLIKMDPSATAQPVQVTVNGGSTPIEISPGGGFLYANPNPAAGITSLSIAFPTSCVVRIWAMGQ